MLGTGDHAAQAVNIEQNIDKDSYQEAPDKTLGDHNVVSRKKGATKRGVGFGDAVLVPPRPESPTSASAPSLKPPAPQPRASYSLGRGANRGASPVRSASQSRSRGGMGQTEPGQERQSPTGGDSEDEEEVMSEEAIEAEARRRSEAHERYLKVSLAVTADALFSDCSEPHDRSYPPISIARLRKLTTKTPRCDTTGRSSRRLLRHSRMMLSSR